MKRPEHYANWVRRVHALEDTTPIDLDLLAALCGIPVAECELTSALGIWVRAGTTQGILLAAGQQPRRRRFTLAHELGHACIPTHSKATALHCLEADLSGADVNRSIEAEANAFAAELLAPKSLVKSKVSTGNIGLRMANAVADHFDISLTSAATRVVECCGEPAAVVLSESGLVKWLVRRGEFPWGLPATGDRVPRDSVAGDVWAGGEGSLDAVPVDPVVWLPKVPGKFTLMESAIRLGSHAQCLSLLWIPDLHHGPDDEED